MYVVEDLDPTYKYLPYVAHVEEIPNPNNPKESVKQISYLRTYPAYPWKLVDGKSHSGEDPIKFVNICAERGLVKWEKAEEREARLAREGITDTTRVSYSDYLHDQELINNMPEEYGTGGEY